MAVSNPSMLAARLTPFGRGAVATIRVSILVPEARAAIAKPDSPHLPLHDSTRMVALNRLFQSANGLPLSEQPIHKITYGKWGSNDAEDLVVCRTSARNIEIHCHGGDAAVRRVLSDLETVGCRIVDWREQTLLMDGLLDSECSEVLSRTSTWRTTRVVLQQSNGLLKAAFERILELGRRIESLEHASPITQSSAVLLQQPELTDRHEEKAVWETRLNELVDHLMDWANFGLHLSTPWNVVLTGRPNVGKSSLINALLGYQRAIVFDQPGTTRDVVTGETAFDGWPVILADTAGIRETTGALEAAGIELARARLEEADARIVLIDTSQPATNDDHKILADWPQAVVVAHKSDLPDKWGGQLPKNAIPVSSMTGCGLDLLQKELVHRLVPVTPTAETPIPITTRQVDTLRAIRSSTTTRDRSGALLRLLENR